MKDAHICFIEIPRKLWETEPASRSLQELAKDAMSVERRIQKNINTASERQRYTLLCRWIEEQALSFVGDKRASYWHLWSGDRAQRYLRLIEELERTEITILERATRRFAIHEALLGFFSALRADGVKMLRTARRSAEHQDAKIRLYMAYDVLLRAIHLRPRFPSLQPSEIRIGKSFYPPGAEVERQCILCIALLGACTSPALTEAIRERAAIYHAAAQAGTAVVEVVSMM